MECFRNVKREWRTSRSYVTEADIAVQTTLRRQLQERFPDDGVIAEEMDLRVVPASGDRHWIIDPIDGTASFVAGLPVWGIGIARVEDYIPTCGFFYIPMTGDYYSATPDGGVRLNGEPATMKAPRDMHMESLMLSYSRVHRKYRLAPEYPGKMRSLGSTIAHMCFAATGGADVALLGRVHLWDLAPGLALLRQNGGVLRYLHGPPVDLRDLFAGAQARAEMICGHPDAVTRFEAMLTPIGR